MGQFLGINYQIQHRQSINSVFTATEASEILGIYKKICKHDVSYKRNNWVIFKNFLQNATSPTR